MIIKGFWNCGETHIQILLFNLLSLRELSQEKSNQESGNRQNQCLIIEFAVNSAKQMNEMFNLCYFIRFVNPRY